MRRKNVKIWILLVLMLCSGLFKTTAQAETGQMQVLIVVDSSGSLQEEEQAVKQALTMFYTWVQSTTLCSNADAIAFSDKARSISLDEVDKVRMGGSTCISAGLEAADEWIGKQVEDGKQVCVIVISDLISSPGTAYSMEEAKREQQAVDAVIERWKEYKKEDLLEYLFVTWKSDDVQTLDKLDADVQRVEEFCCTISEKRDVHWLDSGMTMDGEKTVSQIEMTGEMLQKIYQTLTGANVKEKNKKNFDRDDIIKMGGFFEAYILLGSGNSLTADGTTNELSPMCSTDTMQLFYMGANQSGKEIRVKTKEENCKTYCFYVPRSMPTVSFNVTDKKAEQAFNIYCEYKDAYQKKMLLEPLQAVIYKENDLSAVVCKEEMYLNEEGNYECTVCLDEAGIYSCEIQMSDGQVLRTKQIIVDEGEKKTNTDEEKVEAVNGTADMSAEERNMPDSVVICIIGILLVGGAIVLLHRR